MQDLIIIGAGPAGLASGLYAARNKLKTLIIAKQLYLPANEAFSEGKFIFPNLNRHLDEMDEYLELKENTEVKNIEKNVVSFSVEDHTGLVHYCRAIIIASGRENSGSGEGYTAFDRLTQKDVYNRIKVNSAMQTSVPGIFAAGAVIDGKSADIFISAAQGAQAALSLVEHLKNHT